MADPHFYHVQRYQDAETAAHERDLAIEQRAEELWHSDFGVHMAENWGEDWDDKLCALVRKYPKEPFSIAVWEMLERQAEREAK